MVAVNTILAVNPFLYAKPGFEPLRDFEPISMAAKISEVLVVNASVGAQSVAEFVNLAKAKPAQIGYSSGGNGHPTHLMMELFQRKAGFRLSHVPYKGTPQAVQAVLAAEVGVMNIGIGLVRPHIASGKLIALAKTGFPSPDSLPGVPALTATYPDAEYVPWLAVYGPRECPRRSWTSLSAWPARRSPRPK